MQALDDGANPVRGPGRILRLYSPSAVAVLAFHADQGRVRVEARNAGIAHVYAEPKQGRLTGATMVAGIIHIAHLITWAIECGETAAKLLELPFYHPAFGEQLKGALREICAATEMKMRPPADGLARRCRSSRS